MRTHTRDVNEALRKWDIAWFKRNGPSVSSDRVIEIAMHKMRVDNLKISDSLRWESVEWLRERHMKLLYDRPLPSRIDGLPS